MTRRKRNDELELLKKKLRENRPLKGNQKNKPKVENVDQRNLGRKK